MNSLFFLELETTGSVIHVLNCKKNETYQNINYDKTNNSMYMIFLNFFFVI